MVYKWRNFLRTTQPFETLFGRLESAVVSACGVMACVCWSLVAEERKAWSSWWCGTNTPLYSIIPFSFSPPKNSANHLDLLHTLYPQRISILGYFSIMPKYLRFINISNLQNIISQNWHQHKKVSHPKCGSTTSNYQIPNVTLPLQPITF